MSVKICMIGATGRMGVEIIKAAALDDSCEIASAVEYEGSPKIGTDALENAGIGNKGVMVTGDLLGAAESADVIVDFSGANGTKANMEKYKKAGKPLIIGSTGLDDSQIKAIEELSKNIPVILSSNMSMGVNLLAKLTEMAAGILGEDFDIEIFEAHHKHKKDAPSGTALTLGKAAAKGRNISLENAAVYERYGITGERQQGSIGFQALRGGDIAGDHTVFFCGDGERIELTHRASSRQTFAKGALRAAKWLKGKPNGLYSMNDVLGL